MTHPSPAAPAADSAVADAPTDVSVAEHPLRAFADLWRWYQPNLSGSTWLVWATLAGSGVVLACQAVLPLLTQRLLRDPGLDGPVVAALVVVVLVIVGVSLLVANGASAVIKRSAFVLRKRVFSRLLDSRAMRQQGLARSSTVSRHTSDVDHVAAGVQASLEIGVPALIRVLLSLVLLTFVEWRAGVVMWLAAALLLVWHHFHGRRLFLDDRLRMDSSSAVGQLVDESISGARTIAGLHVEDWQQRRFSDAVDELQSASEVQANTVTRIAIGSQAVGLAGLLAVVIFAEYAGGPGLAKVAAALLYVEAVVSSLLVLPPWLRTLQLGVVSQRRIDEVLADPGRLRRPAPAAVATDAPLTMTGLTADLGPGAAMERVSLTLPHTGLVGLVMTDSASPQRLLAVLAGDESAAEGTVTFHGVDVRSPECNHDVKHVSDDAAGFSASALECLRAVAADLTVAAATEVLTAVGLAHLTSPVGALELPLGPGGKELTVDERQRLTLAMALVGRPQVLLIDPLRSLADPDAALTLIASAGLGRQGLTVLVASSADVAEATAAVLFVGRSGAHLGSHRQLLSEVADYSDHWHAKLAATAVDLSVLGVDEQAETRLRTRLITEAYPAGDIVYRQGSPANHTFFIISGHVEIVTSDEGAPPRRVAVLGPGNHCGDLRLAPGELRAETARALDDVVVRSLSREAISAGVAGLLDRPDDERRIIGALLRHGRMRTDELAGQLPVPIPAMRLHEVITTLLAAGAIRLQDGYLVPVAGRRPGRGTSDVFDRLGGL